MAKKKTVWRLFAALTSAESVEAATGEKYSRVGRDYTLIYTTKKKLPGELGAVEITDREAGRLTQAEAGWLMDCNMEILAQEAKANSGEMLKSLSVKVAALEKALQAEKEKEEGADGGRSETEPRP